MEVGQKIMISKGYVLSLIHIYTIDEDIEKLEDKIASLEEDTSKYATDFTKLQEIMDEKTKLENELQVKYERWEYLNNLAEEIANWSNN